MGSGTTALAAKNLGRNFIGIDISPEYCEMAQNRLDDPASVHISKNKKTKALQASLFDRKLT
jgi:modification methylase